MRNVILCWCWSKSKFLEFFSPFYYQHVKGKGICRANLDMPYGCMYHCCHILKCTEGCDLEEGIVREEILTHSFPLMSLLEITLKLTGFPSPSQMGKNVIQDYSEEERCWQTSPLPHPTAASACSRLKLPSLRLHFFFKKKKRSWEKVTHLCT